MGVSNDTFDRIFFHRLSFGVPRTDRIISFSMSTQIFSSFNLGYGGSEWYIRSDFLSSSLFCHACFVIYPFGLPSIFLSINSYLHHYRSTSLPMLQLYCTEVKVAATLYVYMYIYDVAVYTRQFGVLDSTSPGCASVTSKTKLSTQFNQSIKQTLKLKCIALKTIEIIVCSEKMQLSNCRFNA